MPTKTSKIIVLLVGESGSGKTTVSKELGKKYGWSDISSYTTRKPRFAGEQGHIFLSDPEFDLINENDMCAFTIFDGHRYCATNAQADKANIYVIDPQGVVNFKNKYRGKRTPLVIFLHTSEEVRYDRMEKRGDSKFEIQKRLEHDRQEFSHWKDLYDIIIEADDKSPAEIADIIYKSAWSAENKL